MNKEIPSEVKNAIQAVVDLMKSGRLPEVIAKATYGRVGRPSDAWSFSNKLICAWDYMTIKGWEKEAEIDGKKTYSSTQWAKALQEMDFRGKKQWHDKQRQVTRKGNETYILVPLHKKIKERGYHDDEKGFVKLKKDEKAPEGKTEGTQERNIIFGFTLSPVYEKMHTGGKELKEGKLKLPQLPYGEVARFLKIKIIPQAFTGSAYGSYNPVAKEIKLATPDESTFYHELGHAVDDYILTNKRGKGLLGGQHADQEIVAQMSAATLAYMRGYRVKETAAYTKKYVSFYGGPHIEEEILKVIHRIEDVVDFITNFKSAKSPNREAEEKSGEPKSKVEELADRPKERPLPGSALDLYRESMKNIPDDPELVKKNAKKAKKK